MSQIDPQTAIHDQRLAPYAASSAPAWLWSSDGARILWANAAGAAVFNARDADDLAGRTLGPADPHRRQVQQLAGRLSPSGTMRLERLRGFGAALGGLTTCACARLMLAGGQLGVLVAAQTGARAATPASELPLPHPQYDAAPETETETATETSAEEPAAEEHSSGEACLETPPTEKELSVEEAFGEEDSGGEDTARQPPLPPPESPSGTPLPPQPAGMAQDDEQPDELPSPRPEQVVDQPPQGADDTPAATDPFGDEALIARRRHPLRFMWQMDADGRFSFGSDEFTRLIGARTAAAFGRLWSEIADVLDLDPQGRVAAAIASRGTWSGIVLNWPADGSGARLPVEMSGLPIYDHERRFAGYRGFGICRDLEGLARLAAQRRHDALFAPQQSTGNPPDAPPPQETSQGNHASFEVEPSALSDLDVSPPTEPDQAVEPPLNVVPFRSTHEPKPPSLTPVENSAFHEIARQLSARLQSEAGHAADEQTPDESAEAQGAATQPVAPDEDEGEAIATTAPRPDDNASAGWADDAGEQAAPGQPVFDCLPVGVLVYRSELPIYANRAFFECTGYASLDELAEAGGLDALYVESGNYPLGGHLPEDGTPVVISTARGTVGEARLHAIDWDGEAAQALIFAGGPAQAAPLAPDPATPDDGIEAEEFATILETTAEGILLFDDLGRINSCNRSAEALFGLSASAISGRNLIDLFAPESQRAIRDYLEGVKTADAASLLEHGRSALGHAPDGGTLPLSVTIGRTRPDSARYFAILRDQANPRPSDHEASAAQRSADRLAEAKAEIKAEVLAQVSHEIRIPLNAIIGFAEVMIEERFGALGNERYADYMKDIRASGERIIAIIDDMLNLSQIESGKLDLAFVNQDLNALIEQCVSAMQPQANRERIIIRTSLAHGLPPVQADAHALQQIALNLIGISIHLANAGGQVIVSTALTDRGEVVLRVRDTGQGLNDNEIAAAMAPFRTQGALDHLPSENSANLSLTKALVEANRAQFHIKSAPSTGTLIEVVFAITAMQAV